MLFLYKFLTLEKEKMEKFIETIFVLVVFIVTTSIFVDYVRNFRKLTDDYKKHALFFIVTFLLFNISNLTMLFGNMKLKFPMIITIILFYSLVIWLLVMTGKYYCNNIGISDMPIINSFVNKIKINENYFSKKHLKYIIFTVVINIIYSAFLFHIFPSKQSVLVTETDQILFNKLPEGLLFVVTYILGQFLIALIEELSYRLCLQNFIASKFNLKGNKYIAAILLTSIIFALSHFQQTNLPLVKILQTLPIGIGLGFIFKNYGIESCILTHWLFNLVTYFI